MSDGSEPPVNRDRWNSASDDYQAAHGWALGEAPDAWGIWRLPESELGILGEVEGRDVLELGCGGAQWSIALARRGARVIGFDMSDHQLTHARRLVADAGVHVPLVQGDAEHAPFADGSFDLVFSDHGATTFARPEGTVAEAARILRPGGTFAFCSSTPLRDLVWDAVTDDTTETLHADYFDLYRIDDEEAITYQLPYGAWIRLFRQHGLVIEDLVELRPPPGATTSYTGYASHAWARRWPAEHIWEADENRLIRYIRRR